MPKLPSNPTTFDPSIDPPFDRVAARRSVLRITLATMLSNIALAILKGMTGWLAGSAALLSDAANSASDVVHEIIIMVGVRLAAREADADHPYGHERFESVVSILLSVIVFATGASIGIEGIRKVWEGVHRTIPAPEPAALWVAAGVILFKGGMFLYTKARSRSLQSDVLAAAAADHGADVLGTFGGLVGITAARIGLPLADPLACLVISALIIRTSISIFVKATGQMTDRSASPELEEEIRSIIDGDPQVISIDKLLTRLFGDRVYVDIEIGLAGELSLDAAHEIAETLHTKIEQQLPQIKHCMIHVNPH